MTPEEALRRIKIHNEIHNRKEKHFAVHITEALNVAVNALEKQIPKRPDFEGDGYDENGYLIYDTWICPCCEEHYEVDYDDYKHCPNCGQSIDWIEEK